MSKNIKFQLSVDADSILISQVPGEENKSRVILTNLDQQALKQVASSLRNADLLDRFNELVEELE